MIDPAPDPNARYLFLTTLITLITVVVKWVRDEVSTRRAARQATKREAEAKIDRIEVKAKVAEVKTELEGNTAKTVKIEKHLNGERSLQLRERAADKRRIAELTKKKEDIAIAEAAENAARDHDAKQLDG